MLQHFNSRARGIVCFRHCHRPGVPRDVHDPAIREPGDQFRYVLNINRELHAGPVAPAEPRNLLDKNSRDRS